LSRIEKLLEYIQNNDKDSFLQHALALEYIKIGDDEAARKLFNEILLREPSYVGSYYHLGKLLERAGDFDKAVRIYARGMEEAKKAGDNHSYNELQAAKEDIEE
jgi:Tfp pilus assembly protein PilF